MNRTQNVAVTEVFELVFWLSQPHIDVQPVVIGVRQQVLWLSNIVKQRRKLVWHLWSLWLSFY